MSRFRPQRERTLPGLNVASLPDLIFTVLFFFMIVTHMRDVDPKVQYEVPAGTELNRQTNKSGLVYIFIGKPVDAQGQIVSEETKIQLGNRYVAIDEIATEIDKIRQTMPEADRQRLTVSIRADRDTEMGLVNDVKQQLRKAGALNINYSATKKSKNGELK